MDVGDGGTGREERDVGWGVHVGVDVDDWGHLARWVGG